MRGIQVTGGMGDGFTILPTAAKRDIFRLYYTSHSTGQQTIDVYIEDNFRQVVQKTFSFQNEDTEGGEERTEE